MNPRQTALWRVLPGVFLMCALGPASAACRQPDEDADVLPPAGLPLAATPPVVTSPAGSVRFGRGWYPIESNAQGNWRWMGQTGEMFVPNERAKAHLKIAGWAPVDLLPKRPMLRVLVNDHEIDRFSASTDRFAKEYDIGRDLQADGPESIVRLETSIAACAPGDPRSLGFALVSIWWGPAP